MNNKRASLELLRKLGIFSGFCILVIVIMILIIHITYRPWQTKLKQNVFDVLEENSPGEWYIGDFVELNSSFAQNAACFEISNKTNSKKNYAVIIRVQTFFGPFAAVYTYNENDGASFIGFSNLHGRIATLLKNHKSDSHILFWGKRITTIMQKSLGEAK